MTSPGGVRPFYTVGHSTRSIEEFTALLGEAAIQVLADVRSIPGSRRNPQFNIEVLPGSMGEAGIRYEHLTELGGRRHRPRDAPASPNTFWQNEAFRNYADYAMTAPFAHGLARLRDLAVAGNCAVMCAEAVWWRCHRRIISDYLLTQGFDVLHILGAHRIEAATLTPGAQRQPDGTLVYRTLE
jgi:uncharacterized protein (DUF488 family)